MEINTNIGGIFIKIFILGIKTVLPNVIRIYVRIALEANRNTLEPTINEFKNISGFAGIFA